MASGRSRGFLTALVGVPIGLVFLWLALRDADLDAVRRSLQEADAGMIALAVAAFGVVYAFQSTRWRKIASTPAVRLSRFYEMTVSGVAVNNVLPGRIGDLLRARCLGLAARVPAGRAFGTVMLDDVPDCGLFVQTRDDDGDLRRRRRHRCPTLARWGVALSRRRAALVASARRSGLR